MERERNGYVLPETAVIKCNMLKCSEDSDVRQLYEARCQKEYNASISKNQMIRQVWRPTVEERICAQAAAAAHKKCVNSKKSFWNRQWNSEKEE